MMAVSSPDTVRGMNGSNLQQRHTRKFAGAWPLAMQLRTQTIATHHTVLTFNNNKKPHLFNHPDPN